MLLVDLNKEMAWVTFLYNDWQSKWFPVTDSLGRHLEFSSVDTMEVCRKAFPDVSWGIAPTSQMVLGNAVRNNL